MSERLHRWGPLALVGVTCLLPLFGLWHAPGAPMEEGFMLTFPELVLKGFVPHRDFLLPRVEWSCFVVVERRRIAGKKAADRQ